MNERTTEREKKRERETLTFCVLIIWGENNKILLLIERFKLAASRFMKKNKKKL